MEDVQTHEVPSATPSVDPDVEMEDISEKPIPVATDKVAEIVKETPAPADLAEELNNDPTLESNSENLADESMDVLDENKLLEEDSKPEEEVKDVKESTTDSPDNVTKDKTDVKNNTESTETIIEDTESIPKSNKLNHETNNVSSKTVVDIDDENDTLVLNSDLDSGSSEHDNGDHIDDDFDEEDNDDHMYDIISEGKASIYIPAGKKGVFYNPVQEFNRDLSVAVLTVFAKDHQSDPTVKKYQKKMKWATATSETEDEEEEEEIDDSLPPAPGRKCKNGISVLDALSATGLRSMRYGLEVAGVNTVMANDMSEVAVKIIDKNVKLNQLNRLVVSRRFDAIHLMQLEKIRGRHFDAIDLDPFGNPTRFLDAAVSSLRDGGLLLVTCTDMAVLCGNTPETCYVKYNAVSLKTAACHEMALRICLHLIETVCSKYGRFIVPLLSFHADFYIRVFVKVFTSPQTCKATSTKTSMVFKCIGCNTLSFQPLGMVYQVSGQTKFNLSHGPVVGAKCVHCEGRHVMAGPIWTGPLHDAAFVRQVLDTSESLQLKNTRRITGMLAVILEELKDVPLYYTLTNLCSVLHCEVIPMQEFRSALLHGGYKVSLSHCSKNSFKTNAPMTVVWDILRCWIKIHPIAEKRLEDTTVRTLLNKDPGFEADFSYHVESMAESTGLLRYQPNPAPFWGPGRKSTTNIGDARPKSNNTHPARDSPTAFDESTGDNNGHPPPSKRFKKSNEPGGGNKSIELITLSDEEEEEDGDSLDKEIFSFSLAKGSDANHVGGSAASLNAIQIKAALAGGAAGGGRIKSNKVIEEYTLCDDEDDDDDLRIVNGNIRDPKKRGLDTSGGDTEDKTLDDLEKELNQEIEKFDQKTKSAALSEKDAKLGMSDASSRCGAGNEADDVVYELDESETSESTEGAKKASLFDESTKTASGTKNTDSSPSAESAKNSEKSGESGKSATKSDVASDKKSEGEQSTEESVKERLTAGNEALEDGENEIFEVSDSNDGKSSGRIGDAGSEEVKTKDDGLEESEKELEKELLGISEEEGGKDGKTGVNTSVDEIESAILDKEMADLEADATKEKIGEELLGGDGRTGEVSNDGGKVEDKRTEEVALEEELDTMISEGQEGKE